MTGPAADVEPGLGGDHLVPSPDGIATAYLLLALRLDQRLPGFVDGYFGPAALKAQVDLEPLRPAARLADEAAGLAARVAAEIDDPLRRAWLTGQLRAIEANARTLAEAPGGRTGADYLEHVARSFDWLPARRPAALFTDAQSEIQRLLPGPGPVADRLEAWDNGLVVPVERLPAVIDWLVERFRRQAAETFGLPPGEGLRVSLVRDQPWAGYNWYDGNLQSRVDLNLDLPIRAPNLIGLIAHESYPGHHLEHAWKELRLVREERRLECSIVLLNTPECLIGEGLADLGRRFAVPADQEAGLLEELLDRSGIPTGADGPALPELAAIAIALREPRSQLRQFEVNAALRRHVDGAAHDTVRRELETTALLAPKRAEKLLDFIEDPLFRTYVFVYPEGEALLRRWL
ncbi:MAG TPA: hypothetical protein VIB99_06055, partial [Candidatus Limnocylindrales bacterium]